MSERFNAELGNGRYVRVTEWKEEPRVDIREWESKNDKWIPTKKGVSLPLCRWKVFVDGIEYVDTALKDREAYKFHLGGNVYCGVQSNSPCVDIRQYWKPEDKSDIVPTKKGICLRPTEYAKLKEVVGNVGESVPELDGVVPCFLQPDHANQLGYLGCSECNPDDFVNWQ